VAIKPGEDWGTPTTAAPDAEVTGDDADLALAVVHQPGALLRFRPTAESDLARAVGAQADGTAGIELPMDALDVEGYGLACNMVVLGITPERLRRLSPRTELIVAVDGQEWVHDRATTVVVATGQFRNGLDLVPRGHPGDGRLEVQVYSLDPGERAGMKARLASGTHVPHPRIAQRTARNITVTWWPRGPREGHSIELDGHGRGSAMEASIKVIPSAYRLLV
jgi:hypothetical protein